MNFISKYMFWSVIIFIFSMIFYCVSLFMVMYNINLFMDWELITLNSCGLVITFFFDWMSLLFVSCVMLISSMVVYYSMNYMISDLNKDRFLILVLFFVMSMVIMIISPNLIMILIGWDGLGLISYCLVIYFNNYSSYNSGMLTVLTNRIGDVGILLSSGILFNSGSWHFLYYSFYSYGWGFNLVLLIIISAFTSSAQIPFSSWLPAAMAAPTPVSALVHSSTLVTAGVYLLIRFSNLIAQYDMTFFFILSVLTMFMSGLGANFEFDLKKIIALSTLSQLGLMMSILFMGYNIISFFHLITHAFFKALLFLCAGLMIHCMNDSQDIRYMGNLINHLPLMSSCFMISNMSLCGLPFLSGFYSKDLILEIMTMNGVNMFIYFIFYLSIGLTVSYSIRVIYYCMLGNNNLIPYYELYEDMTLVKPMFLLVIFSILGGSLFGWLLFTSPSIIILSIELKIMCLFMILTGIFLGYEFYYFYYNYFIVSMNFGIFLDFFSKMWFMPNFSTYVIVRPVLHMSKNLMMFMDEGWGEFLISNLMIMYYLFLSKLMLYYQNNNIKLFICSFIMIVMIFVMI
uniref:NADH dehydrogenase subunit 5 n=1 Tax=Paramarcius puncticeps TaxID=2924071 RepID=UPI001FA7D98C|nr:NADH dehydrogenase subunit 5 [Paramarcius puncticeps]UMY75890.1 NADH dehydrogenase subunit 5 [Paramarcius puncticeps]